MLNSVFAPYFGPFTCSPNSSPNLFVLQGISIPHSVIFMRGFFFDEAGFRIPSSRRLPVNFRQVCLTNYFCGNLLGSFDGECASARVEQTQFFGDLRSHDSHQLFFCPISCGRRQVMNVVWVIRTTSIVKFLTRQYLKYLGTNVFSGRTRFSGIGSS